ncbi:hypothetical protein EKD04_017495 [Chloroflexales bacterium ZM16-3]|nr:hypothetical protein [Chloroflexales bacterium ZM16-3]
MRTLAIALIVLTAAFLPSVARGRDPPIFTPPADVHFEVTIDGLVARWWQTGSADSVILTIECAGKDQFFYEEGAPGDHRRVISFTSEIPHPLLACLRIAEYDNGTFLGKTAPLPLALAVVLLPLVRR